MVKTVLCYLKKNDSYLMLFRNKKKDDFNKGKWIGVGGHVESNEIPDEAAIREVKEETNFDVHSLKCAGEVLFVDDNMNMMMYVYEITDFSGKQIECNEGTLKWIPIKDIYDYPMWEGDKAFLPLLINHESYFKMTLTYKNDELLSVKNNIQF